ncbi:sentrin-specific protease 5 [Larimichthys crocea]|uniref:sentrin-specific protease 5 n=1 Tax=Larimichthys crocea TaxID=215358 RepID=UPI000F5FD5AD|nr:sentrin-specific protease 5 [Larimichthys crocea]XP_027146177.1 sentrin-specific protease 5 [Larimichthys crocea]
MVHSGSASPMTTTPSASPQLTVPATTPPLQAAPDVPPPGDITDQDLTQTPANIQSHTTDLTSNSELTQASTLSPADAEPHVITPGKALATNSDPASAWSSTQASALAQGSVNGRTSGRKRTPKACDCCGPNSTGHNVRTSGRGRGRGRARGRGAGSDLWDTPKRKVGGQLTHIKCFDLTKEMVEEAEDEDDSYEKVQTTVVVADTQARTPVSLPVSVSLQYGPIRNSVAPEKWDAQKMEDVLIEGSGVDGAGGKGDDDSKDVEMRLSGMAVRGKGGRGMVGASSASNMEVEGGFRRGGFGSGVIGLKTYARPRLMFMQRQGPNKDAQVDLEEQPDPSSVKSAFGNGDTVNLSDTEPEEEAKEDNMTLSEMENGLLSCSRQSRPASRSGSSQDLDSEMQVDQTPDGTDSVSLPVALSNGNITSTNEDHCSTLMEVETSHPPTVVLSSQGPITVSSMEHHGALRDHRLYCQPGTWGKKEMEEVSGKDGEMDEKTEDEENLEQLTDLIHEFLESFYIKYGGFIPLSETDVLEYLKKKKGNSDLSNRGLDIKREMSRYRAGLASAPVAGFMVTYNKHNLGLEDLGTLEEQNWLNDQIINMYGELIMEATQHKVHFFNSFFHKQLVAKGYDGVKRWTKKVDLFSKWLLLIPIHLEIHWSLVTVTMATKTISYYDSQGIVFRHTTDNIMKYLLSEAREKKQTAFQKGWKITIIKGIPQQKNDSDCGVFVLEYCRCLSVKQPLLFSQEDMPRIRKRIYKELCDCRLND